MWMNGEELGAGRVHTTKYECRTNVALVAIHAIRMILNILKSQGAYRKSICLSIVMAVTTRGLRPVESAWSSMLEEMRAVVNSVSAAVPAPQQRMLSVI